MLAIPVPPIAAASMGLRILQPALNRAILRALSASEMSVSALCAHLMLESDTTLREQLGHLELTGAVESKGEAPKARSYYRLTAAGEDLLEVMALIGVWLTGRPRRPLSPESEVAWRAVTALGDGWELSLIHHLLLRPRTKAELLRAIPVLGAGKAKRILRRLRGAGLVTRLDGAGRAPRFAVTAWARRAIAVLGATVRWEGRHLTGTAEPVPASHGGVALIATLPLIRLPASASGICAFTVEGEPDARPPRACAVWAGFDRGRVAACRSGSSPSPPDAWVRGGMDAWLRAVIDAQPTALHLAGDVALAERTLDSLHTELFGASNGPPWWEVDTVS
jgi:DNA-binding HxlR family transcriptional regulator